MSRFTVSLVAAITLATLFFGLVRITQGQGATIPDGEQTVVREEQSGSVRERSAPIGAASVEEPNIGFIESPSATCYQPDAAQDACFVNWYYLSVDAAPNYMITMTATINPKVAAHVQGFFQTSMYVPYNMLGQGFRVACGALGAGGNPTLGNAYAYTIRARDSSNLGAANYGTVYCPAYIP